MRSDASSKSYTIRVKIDIAITMEASIVGMLVVKLEVRILGIRSKEYCSRTILISGQAPP